MNRNNKKKCILWVVMLLCMTLLFSLSASAATKKVKKITLSKTKLTMTVGKKKTLKCTVKPSGASKKVVWKSSKTSVVSVSKKGVLTAKKAGKATITCSSKKYPKIKATCKVTVKKPAAKEITLSETELSLKVNESKDLTAEVSPDQAPQEVAWESSDTSVATVSDEGKVVAVKAGTADITCSSVKYPKVSAVCKVTVKKEAQPLTDDKELANFKLILARTAEPYYQWKIKRQTPGSKSGNGGLLWQVTQNANATINYITAYNDYVGLGRTYCMYNIPTVTLKMQSGGSSIRSAVMDGSYDFKNDPNELLIVWSAFTSSTSKAEFEKMINASISDSAFTAVHDKASRGGTYTNGAQGGSCIIVYGKDSSGTLVGKFAGVISCNMITNGCLYELVGINPENQKYYGLTTGDTQGYAMY